MSLPESRKTSAARDGEADRIYQAIFADAIPDVIRERFAEPSQALDRSAPTSELAAYRDVLARVNDLEAAEVAARFTRRLPLLSRKFQLMVYLAETIPSNQSRFINTRDSLVVGILTILYGGVRTAFKVCKGAILLRGVARA